jgi:hypothetical protein
VHPVFLRVGADLVALHTLELVARPSAAWVGAGDRLPASF